MCHKFVQEDWFICKVISCENSEDIRELTEWMFAGGNVELLWFESYLSRK